MTTIIEERPVACVPAAALIPTALPTRVLPAMPNEFLSFRGEEYGIDILRVQEIRSYEAPTRIANAPHFIKGVVNLRGVIVPIVDLRLKLACQTAKCSFDEAGNYRGWNAMMPMPVRATATPATSHAEGRMPSTAQSHAMATAM